MQGLDLRLLPALDALLNDRNVTVAARRLGLSQPTMSGILSRLREQLRDPLLVQVGRSSELTPRATAMKDEVRQILLSAEKLSLGGTLADGRLRGRFTIMTSEFGLYLVLPELFRSIADSPHDIEIAALPINRPVDSVFNGLADLCITGERIDNTPVIASEMLRTRTLVEDRFIALVDAEHPLRGRATLDQLSHYPRVAASFGRDDSTAEDVSMAELSKRYPPMCRVPSFLAIAPFVVETKALGLVPSLLYPHLTCQGRVRAVELDSEFEPIAVKMLWHSRFDLEPAHLWLRDQVVTLCQSLRMLFGIIERLK